MTEIEIKDARTEMAMLWLSMNAQKTEVELNAINKKIDELNRKLEQSKDEEEKPIKWARCLRFNQKEIAKMPKRYQKFFKTEQVRAIVTLRADGVFAVRCRKPKEYGINIEVYSKDLEKAKQKFIQKLKENAENGEKNERISLMTDYIEKYISSNARHVVEANTKNKLQIYKRHIAPAVQGLNVKKVTASICEKLIGSLIDEGKERTAEDVRHILKKAFDLAIGDNLISKNPIDFVEYSKHVRKNGKRLPDDVIKKILLDDSSTAYDLAIKVCLLTGIRPAELASAELEENFLKVKNAKEKKNVSTYRKIPVCSQWLETVKAFTERKGCNTKHISNRFADRFGGGKYKLYDCRHTFTTVCVECGISKSCIDLWLNHKSQDMTQAVYTHITEEYQLEEIKKFHYPI